jgi:hypothetical protein
MAITVEFRNVGRGKRTWIANLPNLSDAALYREVSKSGALANQGIDFDVSEDGSGTIYVGGFRPVGTFQTVEVE